MRYLKFTNDEESRQRYALIYLALVKSGRKNSMTDLSTITDLTREIRQAGEETEKEGRVPLYELADKIPPEGITVPLESGEYKMLNSLIEFTPWSSGMAPEVTALRDWLKDVPKDKEKLAEKKDVPLADASDTAEE